MKNSVRALWVTLIATMLLAGCSKPTENSTTPAETPAAAPSAEAPQSAAPATAETQPAPTPAPEPAPAPPVKQPTRRTPAPAARNTPNAAPAPAPAPAPAAEPSRPAPAAQPEVKSSAAADNTAPREPSVQRITLPTGTLIPVRMIDSVDSKTDQVGQTFRASVDSNVVVDNQTVIPKGANVQLKLNNVSSAGAIRGKSQLELQLDRITVGNKSYPVVTDVVQREGASQGKKTARNTAIGGAIGAAIGAIAGGGKGAAIGAGVGAGSGAAVAVITKGDQVVVPSESQLEFRLQQPIEVEKR